MTDTIIIKDTLPTTLPIFVTFQSGGKWIRGTVMVRIRGETTATLLSSNLTFIACLPCHLRGRISALIHKALKGRYGSQSFSGVHVHSSLL